MKAFTRFGKDHYRPINTALFLQTSMRVKPIGSGLNNGKLKLMGVAWRNGRIAHIRHAVLAVRQ